MLGEKAKIIGSLLLGKLLLQLLRSNVYMILALADTMTLDKLAEMADRIMDLAIPMITSISTPAEGGELRRMITEEVTGALRS